MDHHSDDDGGLTCWALPGIPEIHPGMKLEEVLAQALTDHAASRPERALRDGDVLVITSKILSKAEGRIQPAQDREQAITAETVRVVARRPRADGQGETRIVENRLGIVAAAAGVDASNTAAGTVLLLPEDPDASAQRLRAALRQHFRVTLGVIISDTLGRAWRIGQTDVAIGAAGIQVLFDHRGGKDSYGRALEATQIAVVDELAGMADMVKGKAAGLPVAVIRGAGHLVEPSDSPTLGARSLLRAAEQDMFRMGTDEAIAQGYRRGREEAGS